LNKRLERSFVRLRRTQSSETGATPDALRVSMGGLWQADSSVQRNALEKWRCRMQHERVQIGVIGSTSERHN
jgi:hypothetical protein